MSCSTSRRRQRTAKTFLIIWSPLWVNLYAGIPNDMNQLFKNIFAISIKFTLPVGIALVNFVNLSVFIKPCWFPVEVYGRILKLSMATNWRGLSVWKSWSFRFCISWSPFWADEQNLSASVYMSFIMCDQWKCCHVLSYIRLVLDRLSRGSVTSIRCSQITWWGNPFWTARLIGAGPMRILSRS